MVCVMCYMPVVAVLVFQWLFAFFQKLWNNRKGAAAEQVADGKGDAVASCGADAKCATKEAEPAAEPTAAKEQTVQ